jgi:peroxiredoxin
VCQLAGGVTRALNRAKPNGWWPTGEERNYVRRERLVFVILVGSVVMNVMFAHRLREFNHLLGKTSEQALKPGTLVAPFDAVDLQGQTQTVVYNNVAKPTVLYIFTPPCSWCARNMSNFKELVARREGEYRFIGVSLSREDLPEYVAKNELRIPIYSGLSKEMQRAYKLGGTPQTIVVSPEGRILQDWVGAYVGSQKSQVEAFFRLSLPGLTAAAESE